MLIELAPKCVQKRGCGNKVGAGECERDSLKPESQLVREQTVFVVCD